MWQGIHFFEETSPLVDLEIVGLAQFKVPWCRGVSGESQEVLKILDEQSPWFVHMVWWVILQAIY